MEQSPPIGQRNRILLQGGAIPARLTPFEIVVLVTALALTAYAAYAVYARQTNLNATPASVPTYLPAFRTTLTSSVSSTGTVSSTQQVTLTFGSTGKISQFFARLGDQVVQGQPLAKIDDTDLLTALGSAQTALASAQARYEAATKGPSDIDTATAQQAITTAQAAVNTAIDTLTALRAGPRQADIAAAQQAVTSAQTALQNAEDAIPKAQSTLASDRASITSAQNSVASAQNSLTSAQNAVAMAQAGVSSAQAALASAQAALSAAKAKAALSTATAADKAAVTTAESAVAKAQTDLTSAQNTLTTSQNALTTANNSLTTAQNSVRLATSKLQDDTNNVTNGNLERAVDNAKLTLKTAQTKLNEVLSGPTQAELAAAQRAIDSAQTSLKSAQAKYAALFDPPAADVLLPLQASIDSARANVDTAQKNLTAATIVAPFEGRISQVTGEVGTQVSPTTAVFILLNPNLIRLDANIDQADVSNLKPGQTATATFDALSGRSYPATVTAIGLTPTTANGVVTYSATFGVDTSRLAPGTPIPTPGMTGSLTITTSNTPNALVVPARAIRRSGRTATVTVQTANGDESKTVTTGATNGTLTQIVSGIDEGDAVLVAAPATNTSTTTNRTTGLGGQGTFQGGGVFIAPAGGGAAPAGR